MNKLPQLGPEDLDFLTKHLEYELERARQDPLNHGAIRPHPKQEEVLSSPCSHVLLICGNRFGKSTVAIMDALWRARGDHPFKRVRLHNTIWLGVPDSKFAGRVTEPIFNSLCPRDWKIGEHKTDNWVDVRRVDGGVCRIWTLSYDSGREAWQGASVDFLHFDEEPPEDVYREGVTRTIDVSGEILNTLTPVSGMGWIYDRLFLPAQAEQHKPPEDRQVHLIEGGLCEEDPRYELSVGRPLVPHLTRSQILKLARKVPDPDERAIRIFGQYRARSGVVYKQFRGDVHVVPRFPIPSHWDIWCGLDPGFHGFAVMFMTRSPTGEAYVIEEYYSQEEVASVRARGIWERYWRLRYPDRSEEDALDLLRSNPLILYVDTEDPQLVLEMNTWAQDEEVPLAFASLDQGRKARKAGITRIQQLLAPHALRVKPPVVRRPPPAGLGEPLLYAFDDLWSQWRMNVGDEVEVIEGSRFVWEITRYLWKKMRPTDPHPSDADDNSAGGAHAMAATRYAVMARIGPPQEPKEDQFAHLPPRAREVWQRVDQYAKEMEENGEEE